METAVHLGIGNNGFTTWLGNSFENISGVALYIKLVGGTNVKNRGHVISSCDFKNCGKSIFAESDVSIDNCTIEAKGGATGISGAIQSVIRVTMKGVDSALSGLSSSSVVAFVQADGRIDPSSAWIGASKFSNLECKGACIGTQDLSAYVNTEPLAIDQTPPSAPTGLTQTRSGNHTILKWQRSSDPETKIMQYVIEKKVDVNWQEIGRTNFNYSSNFHRLEKDWTKDGYPGVGLYRDPNPIYVDSNSQAGAEYRVSALNFAYLSSTGERPVLRMWPHNVWPQWLAEPDGTPVPNSDSIIVPLGKLNLDKPSYTFRAVKYLPYSCAFGGPGCPSEDVSFSPDVLAIPTSIQMEAKKPRFRSSAKIQSLEILRGRHRIFH